MHFDGLLEHIGRFGLYQKKRFYLFCCPVAFVSSLTAYLLLFITATPKFTCDNNSNSTNVTAWQANFSMSSSNYSSVLQSTGIGSSDSSDRNKGCFDWTNATQQPCVSGYEFARTDWDETLVTRWNLVCGQSWIVNFMFTLSSCGGIFGMLLFPYLLDHYGRKPTFFLVLTWYLCTGVLYLVVPTWNWFAFIVFLRGFSASPLFEIPWIVGIELVGTGKRTFVLVWMCVVYALACAILPVIAWLCRLWSQLVLICIIPFALLYAYWFLLDESPRWLISIGRKKAAVKILKRMAKENSVQIEQIEIERAVEKLQLEIEVKATELQKMAAVAKLADTADSAADGQLESKAFLSGEDISKQHGLAVLEDVDQQSYSFVTILRHRNLLLKFLIVAFIWGVNAIIYDGLMLNVEYLGGNPFFIFGLNALVEILSYLFIWVLLDRIGRIGPLALTLVATGVASIASAIVIPYQLTWLVVSFSLVAKFFISASYAIIYLMGSEVFPTVVRASGLGICAVLAKLMHLPTPFIIYSTNVNRMLPMSIFGFLSALAGILTCFLPETANQDMLDRIEDDWKQPVGVKTFYINLKALRNVLDYKKERERRSNGRTCENVAANDSR